LAAFCRRSPDSPTQMLSTSLDTRISRMGFPALASFCGSQAVGREGGEGPGHPLGPLQGLQGPWAPHTTPSWRRDDAGAASAAAHHHGGALSNQQTQSCRCWAKEGAGERRGLAFAVAHGKVFAGSVFAKKSRGRGERV
jgi:hypothetical protein